jgi:hypothetical protein
VGGYRTRLVARLLCGCGLRVNEPLALTMKDVNVPERTMVIREARGGKDRMVSPPECLAWEMEGQLRVAGVGITRVGAGDVLKVNLESKPPRESRLPMEIGGVPVRVEVAGRMTKRTAK